MTKFNGYITLLGLLVILIISACAENSGMEAQENLSTFKEANGWYGELWWAFPNHLFLLNIG